MKPVRILIVGLVDGSHTPFDGEYLVEYDPTRPGVDPRGEPMTAHIVTTPDKEKAWVFRDLAEALEVWKRAHGIRPDGEPNRPLTAFTVEVA